MAALNWEKDRSRRLCKEYSFDDLPPAGSFADQIRCGVYPFNRTHRRRSGKKEPVTVLTSSRQNDFDLLRRYLNHAVRPDFRNKATVQRSEIILCIKKLISRCESWPPEASRSHDGLIIRAKIFLSNQKT